MFTYTRKCLSKAGADCVLRPHQSLMLLNKPSGYALLPLRKLLNCIKVILLKRRPHVAYSYSAIVDIKVMWSRLKHLTQPLFVYRFQLMFFPEELPALDGGKRAQDLIGYSVGFGFVPCTTCHQVQAPFCP